MSSFSEITKFFTADPEDRLRAERSLQIRSGRAGQIKGVCFQMQIGDGAGPAGNGQVEPALLQNGIRSSQPLFVRFRQLGQQRLHQSRNKGEALKSFPQDVEVEDRPVRELDISGAGQRLQQLRLRDSL